MMSYLCFKVIHAWGWEKVNGHIDEIKLTFSWYLVKSGSGTWESIILLSPLLHMFGIF